MTDEQIIAIYDDFYTQEDERESDHILPFARALLSASKPAAPAQSAVVTNDDITSAWFATSDARNLLPHERAIEVVRKFINAPQPSPTAVVLDDDACAHDYVRPDRVCTECGERAASPQPVAQTKE